MAPSLPVPSKRALRALRHLALGTSCAVAFGAGLVTADRRRRIQSAHEICENARRIKTSRRYHSAGTTVATSFQEQIENYCQNGPWKGSDKERLLQLQWSDETPDPAPQPLISQEEPEITFDTVHSSRPVSLHVKAPVFLDIYVEDKVKYLTQPKVLIPNQLNDVAAVQAPTTGLSRQERLAREVLHHLQDESNLDMLSKAAATLSQAFADGLRIHDLEEPLLDACIHFGQTCERLECFKFFVPVLKNILAYGRVDEQAFFALRATTVMAQLLEESGYEKDGSDLAGTNPEKLKDAVAIFCTKLRKKPVLILPKMLEIGKQLFTATVQAKLYDLSGCILRYMAFIGGDVTSAEVEIVILADRARRDNEHVLYHFFHLFPQTKPDQISFNPVVRAALDTTFDVKRLDKAEKVCLVANQIAKAGGLQMSTTWMLQILGQHWRATRDLTSTQALFSRLEPVIQNTRHPGAVYNAMSQFCVEAGNEIELQKYLDRLKKISPAGSIGVQTYGNLALAEAMKGDWRGVEDNFRSMKSLSPNPSKQTALFVPILKHFAASHEPSEVERFLRFYMERLGVIPNQYISNIMIWSYCKAKDIDSVANWIQYGRTFGFEIDVVSFNIILSKCQDKWRMHFNDLYRLCTEVRATNDGMIDGTTIRILRNAVFSCAGKNSDLTAKLLSKVASLQRSTGCCSPDDIEIVMRDALADGKPTKALEAYEHAIENIVPIKPLAVSLAVRASMEASVEGDLDPAIELVNQARALDLDISPAIVQLLVHKLETANGKDLQSIAIRTLASLEEGGLEVTPGVATKVISLLIDRGFKRAAIELWTSLCARHEKIRESIDIVLLTVLLRAYVQLFDCHGIRWVMDVLSLKNIMPDKRFKMVLKNARAAARKRLETYSSHNVKMQYTLLDDSVRRVAEINTRNLAKQKDAEKKILGIMENAPLGKAGRLSA
jgi:hypothetical protein